MLDNHLKTLKELCGLSFKNNDEQMTTLLRNGKKLESPEMIDVDD